MLDCVRPVTRLERRVTLFACLLTQCRVDVRCLLRIGLGLLRLAKLGEDVGCAVLGERLVEELDRGLEVALALVCAADTAVRLGDQLVVRTELDDSGQACTR